MKKLLPILAVYAVSLSAYTDISPSDNVKLALNMYSNQRARQVGDLVTVTVEESNASKKTEDFATAKTAKADADMPFFGYNIENASNIFQRFRNSLITDAEKNIPIAEYKINASSSFTGDGSTNSLDQITSEFACRVVDILENGVLVIRGDRKLLYKNETVSLVLTGLIRSRDIDNLNKISSKKVADAHIYYETGGELSRGTRPGYVWRVFQVLNPF